MLALAGIRYGAKDIVIRKASPEIIPLIEEMGAHHEKFYETADRLMELHKEEVGIQQNMTVMYFRGEFTKTQDERSHTCTR